jgi:hypothetical protein
MIIRNVVIHIWGGKTRLVRRLACSHHHEVRHPSVPNHAASDPCGTLRRWRKTRTNHPNYPRQKTARHRAGRASACRITEETFVSPRAPYCRVALGRRRDPSLTRQKRLAARGGKTIRRELRNKTRRTESISIESSHRISSLNRAAAPSTLRKHILIF